ncbi:MAG: hypothetical protein LBE64_20915 [Acinetobacter pittii]|jgi:exportin-2 (importin alpha re-exporter)|nr:hypothetical protein [Acinetobacter pittii]
MISLSGEPALQVQIGEAIAIMAESDFPDQWDSLIEVRLRFQDMEHAETSGLVTDFFPLHLQQLTAQLTPDNFIVNNAVLQTAHSIFRR